VTKVEPGSPAFGHGIREGDLIIGVNQRRVTTSPELAKALRASGRLALIGFQYHVFLASMAFVLLADDAYLFMVAWETMALSSYFLVITDHKQAAIRSAGFLYLLVAHLGAIAILLCFGVLHGGHGDYSFDALRATQLQPAWATVAFLLAFAQHDQQHSRRLGRPNSMRHVRRHQHDRLRCRLHVTPADHQDESP